jgi:hypothetical protein
MRIRTTPGDDEKYLKVNLEQKFDFIEILSLKLTQEDVYRKFCSDYGVVVGRVTINSGFGVPNAKVSIFIPIDDIDIEDSELFGLYPYEQIQDKNSDGLRYNLLPKKNETNNDCFTPIGSFFNKREIQDNDVALDVYCKYYKFTTTTNTAGDFMFFGVPVGTYEMHVDADISDIGLISQYPYDFIREGAGEKLFESTSKYKSSNNLTTLSQLKSRSPISVNVQPFWGDIEQCQVGITRSDVDLATNVVPHAIFMGSIFGDNEKNSINKRCRPRAKMGKLSEMTTGPGRIEMIRKNRSGEIESFDVEGGMVIDENGAWAYQIPMNLDYVITDEFGNLVPTDDINKGLPTRARVRFRLGMFSTGSEGRVRTRAKYLVPNNPDSIIDSDYSFDETTKDSSFTDLHWNKIYSVSNHITRINRRCPNANPRLCAITRNYIGLKDVDDEGGKTPHPFNRITTIPNPLFNIICIIISIIAFIVGAINGVIKLINGIIDILNSLFDINPIKYILVGCNEEDYCIKCEPGDSGLPNEGEILDPDNEKWKNCQTLQLVEALNLVRFDFYNDWINGSLYAFLLKYRVRKKGKGKEKFCDYGCDDPDIGADNNEDGQPDNRCFDKFIVDTGTQALPQNSSVYSNNDNISATLEKALVKEGLIKKDKDSGELYYASLTENGYKLFATDIVNLGAVTDCDWQGVPKIYQYLPETSSNLPELQTSFYDDDDILFPGQVEESGWYTNSSSNNLILNVDCGGLKTNSNQVNNIKRLCEIGMGLDEDRRDDGGTQADGLITNNDIENPFVRGAFMYVNSQTLSQIPLVYISPSTSTYSDVNYREFRGYNDNQITSKDVWQFKKSLYFYFGLIGGETALNKMLDKYFPPCVRAIENELKVIITDVQDDNTGSFGNGSITFEVEGGVGPYTYKWVGPTYSGVQYECPSQNNSPCGDPDGGEFTLDNLLPGSYTLVVTDSNGEVVTTTTNVGGITPITCDVQPSPVNTSNNGQVVININNGVPPYTITIQGISNSSFNDTIVSPSQTVCYGSCSSNQLPEGEYLMTVEDTGFTANINGVPTTISTQCSKTFLITQPQLLNLTVDVSDANCYSGNGSGIISINGGVPPYQFTWELLSTQNPNNTNFVNTIISTNIAPQNLPSGNYLVSALDLGGNLATTNINIGEPDDITITTDSLLKPGCYYSTSGFITLNINGGTPPYDILTSSGSTITTTTSQQSGLVEIGPIKAGGYTFNIIDSFGCQKEHSVILPFPSNIVDDILYVTSLLSVVNGSTNRIIIRFRGGHGIGYHFKIGGSPFTTLIGTPSPALQQISSTTLVPDYQIYRSTINAPNGEPLYEFQFTPQSTPQTNQPLIFDYVLTDNNQQDVYALFKGIFKIDVDGNYTGSQDSLRGTTPPRGCYSYRNENNTPVSGVNPQGINITQP